jgi:hypothetical protein
LSSIGLILQLAYRLRRHFWLGWSLARWLGFLLAVAGLGALIRGWPRSWPAMLLGGLLLGYLLFLAWAARRRFVRFEGARGVPSRFQDDPPASPLRKEERVPVRASGWFTVEGMTQYYVDLEAEFETVGTREHIILARLYASRFLLLGNWPEHELGWWYTFFQPAMIQGLSAGRLHFGPQARPALRVVYGHEEEKPQTLYLAFDEASALRRVWDDLARDAPPGVALGL